MSRPRSSRLLPALPVMLALAACGGGGGGAATPASLLFLAGGSFSSESEVHLGLSAVDPAAPTTLLQIEAATTEVRFPLLVQEGIWNAGAGRIERVRTAALVYAKRIGETHAGLFRVDARPTGLAPNPVKVGSLEVPYANLCDVRVLADSEALERSFVLVTTTSDDPCGVGAPVTTLLPVTAADTQPGVTIPADRTILGAIRAADTGAVTGWLAQGPDGLYFESADLAAGSEAFLGAGDPSIVLEAPGRTWLDFSGVLRFYDAASGELRAPPGDPIAWESEGATWDTDGRNLYYGYTVESQSSIFALALDGATAPTEIHQIPASEFLLALKVSAGRVLVHHALYTGDPPQLSLSKWSSVPKAGGPEVVLEQGVVVGDVLVSGDRVYLQPEIGTVGLPMVMREDGEQPVVIPGPGTWTPVGGDAVRIGTSRVANPRWFLLFEDANDPDGDGPEPMSPPRLQGFDGPSGRALATLGSFTGGEEFMQVLAEGSGPSTLLAARGSAPGAALTVFSARANAAGSLAAITSAAADHRFVGTATSSDTGCGAGGSAGLAALGLALVALRRPFRRGPRRAA